jgi:formate hydrogenlyase subunit 3/multisubunit Na+/H+ antiporter MnhD subunit
MGDNGFALLLIAAPLLPLLLAALFIFPGLRSAAVRLSPLAALPGLAAAMFALEREADLPWVLLGTRLGLDLSGQSFLMFTSLLWLIAGIFTTSYMKKYPGFERFTIFYLLAMSGNFGVLLSMDLPSFYFFFAMMSFASYILVIHQQDDFSVRAGKIYIILVVIGEVLLFGGFVLLFTQTGTIYTNEMAMGEVSTLVVALLLVGFSIKAGALPLHFWLPLAHPAAPVPASAVLSGAMIKVGLFGWIRFLPLGFAAFPGLGSLVIGAGLAASFYGALMGVGQTNPKTVLAYSSISQMGLMTVGIGIGLTAPEFWPAALTAIILYAIHHGLAKGALFLGVGMVDGASSRRARQLVTLGLIFPALALAGAPLTSGAVAKAALSAALPGLPGPWPTWLDLLLPLIAVGTTLLMARFLFLVLRSEAKKGYLPAAMWAPWLVLLLGVAFVAWALPIAVDFTRYTLTLYSIWLALWPLGLGLLLAASAGFLSMRKLLPLRPQVPPGDIVVILEGVAGFFSRRRPKPKVPADLEKRPRPRFSEDVAPTLTRMEGLLADFAIAGTLFILTGLVLFLALTSV